MVSKKGQEFSVTTLIVIVLAIIVLVVLALGFGAGWSNLWSKITGFFTPVNVDATKQACQYACTSQSAYAYCCQIREVRFEKGQPIIPMTCYSGKSQLQVESCDIGCVNVCDTIVCKEPSFVGVKVNANPVAGTSCLAANVDSTKTLDSNLAPIAKDKVCCVSGERRCKEELNGDWKAGTTCPGNEVDKTSQASDVAQHLQQKCCV